MKDPYFEDIEAAFVSRRGKHLFLGPKDWLLVAEWKHSGIPLHIVINAIDNVFKNRKDEHRKVNSISYCKQEVEALFAEWSESQVGKHETSEATEPEEDYTTQTQQNLLSRLYKLQEIEAESPDKLKMAIQSVIPLLHAETKNFGQHRNPQKLEEKLTAFEQQLNDALLESVTTVEGMKHLLEIEAELSAYKSQLTKEEFAKQINELFLKRLRERFGVPRLSLFYL